MTSAEDNFTQELNQVVKQIAATDQTIYGLDDQGGLWRWLEYQAPGFGREGCTAGWMFLGHNNLRAMVIPALDPPPPTNRSINEGEL